MIDAPTATEAEITPLVVDSEGLTPIEQKTVDTAPAIARSPDAIARRFLKMNDIQAPAHVEPLGLVPPPEKLQSLPPDRKVKVEQAFDIKGQIDSLKQEQKRRGDASVESKPESPQTISLEEKIALISQGKVDVVIQTITPSASAEFSQAIARKIDKLKEQMNQMLAEYPELYNDMASTVHLETIVRKQAREVMTLNKFVVDLLRLTREVQTTPADSLTGKEIVKEKITEYQKLILAARNRINTLLSDDKVLTRYEQIAQMKVNEPELMKKNASKLNTEQQPPITEVANLAQVDQPVVQAESVEQIPSSPAVSELLPTTAVQPTVESVSPEVQPVQPKPEQPAVLAEASKVESKKEQPLSMEEAKALLGENYIGLEGLELLERQYRKLGIDMGFPMIEGEVPPIPFSKEVLEYAKDHGFMLILRPHRINVGDKISSPKNFSEFQQMLDQYPQQNGIFKMVSYSGADNLPLVGQAVLQNENMYHSGWALVPNGVQEESLGKNFYEQQSENEAINREVGKKYLVMHRSITETLMDLQLIYSHLGGPSLENLVVMTKSIDEWRSLNGDEGLIVFAVGYERGRGIKIMQLRKDEHIGDVSASRQIVAVEEQS